MQTIGERLEEARKRKGITIREASEATKIRGEYLNNFESNEFDINIPDIYIHGFLRSYADYLRLNADKIITDLNATLIGEGKAPKRDNREFFGRLEIHPPIIQEEEAAPAAEKPSGLESAAENEAAPFWENIDRETLIKGGIIAVGSLIFILLLVWGFFALMGSEETVQNEDSDLPPATQMVETTPFKLIAVGDVRVEVIQVDPELSLYFGVMPAGDEREFGAVGSIRIECSEPDNLKIELDGKRYSSPKESFRFNPSAQLAKQQASSSQ